MKHYHVSFTFVDGNRKNLVTEASFIDEVIQTIKDKHWFTKEENGVVQAINLQNVLKAEVSEVDENGPSVGRIDF